MPEFLTSFDIAVARPLNSFLGHSDLFDRFVLLVAQAELLKGVVAMAIFWWVWFAASPDAEDRRERLAAGLVGVVAATAVGKLAAATLPHQPRPIHNEEMGLNVIAGLQQYLNDGVNSLPSDHAVLFFAIAAVIWRASSLAGALCLGHALLVVSIPRVMLGLHSPVDILAGAAIGIAAGLAAAAVASAILRRTGLYAAVSAQPPLLYAALFFATLNIALNYAPLREFGGDVASLVAARAG